MLAFVSGLSLFKDTVQRGITAIYSFHCVLKHNFIFMTNSAGHFLVSTKSVYSVRGELTHSSLMAFPK